MHYEQITFERTGRVGVITLSRPEKLNAWTPRMMAEYRDAIARCNADPEVGAIVMTGAGRAFCAGADIGAVFNAQIEGKGSAGRVERSADAGEDYLTFLRRMPKPTIAAINGAAVGVGITQVLPFDVRIAGRDARIGFFFVRMGLVPELGSSHFLPRLVGLRPRARVVPHGPHDRGGGSPRGRPRHRGRRHRGAPRPGHRARGRAGRAARSTPSA
jgi:2-(1,2-epoxy-1,2-dihydrophenyl)acetyl-CoA isomerase